MMNPRWREIAATCWEERIGGMQFDQEKFAELIVAECIEIVENAVDHREPASEYTNKIREHFGIETVNDTIRRRSTYFGNNP